MNAADNDRLIQYVFPEGPLPVITQVKCNLSNSALMLCGSITAYLVPANPLLDCMLADLLENRGWTKRA